MEIRVGRFILRSDTMCYWIEEEYETKDKKGKTKTTTRKVAGYATSLDSLYRQFTAHKHRAAEATTVEELIKAMKQTAEDIDLIRKTAVKEDLKLMRRVGKEVKEINKEKGIK